MLSISEIKEKYDSVALIKNNKHIGTLSISEGTIITEKHPNKDKKIANKKIFELFNKAIKFEPDNYSRFGWLYIVNLEF